jgi:cation transport regulator ChaC
MLTSQQHVHHHRIVVPSVPSFLHSRSKTKQPTPTKTIPAASTLIALQIRGGLVLLCCCYFAIVSQAFHTVAVRVPTTKRLPFSTLTLPLPLSLLLPSPLTVANMKNENENENKPTWCEEQQIYINGTIASSSHADDYIQSILASIQSSASSSTATSQATSLHIFGYGSLCWKPGSPHEILAHKSVQKTIAKAIGWKRCWCQKSTDHRGTTDFFGLVCTLLSEDEIHNFTNRNTNRNRNRISTRKEEKMISISGSRSSSDSSSSMTEGVLYTIPSHLVEQCLAELDFREKGGYARDVIDVLIQDSGGGSGSLEKQYQKALLYRGMYCIIHTMLYEYVCAEYCTRICYVLCYTRTSSIPYHISIILCSIY